MRLLKEELTEEYEADKQAALTQLSQQKELEMMAAREGWQRKVEDLLEQVKTLVLCCWCDTLYYTSPSDHSFLFLFETSSGRLLISLLHCGVLGVFVACFFLKKVTLAACIPLLVIPKTRLVAAHPELSTEDQKSLSGRQHTLQMQEHAVLCWFVYNKSTYTVIGSLQSYQTKRSDRFHLKKTLP